MKILFHITIASILVTFGDVAGLGREQSMKNTFEIESWDEVPYLEFENSTKYSRAKLSKRYAGAMNGNGQLEYLMAYNEKGAAHFVGIEHFEGEVDGKIGTLSVAHKGSFKKGVVTSTFEIIEGSQTGKLVSLNGQGSYTTGHSMIVDFEFDYAF